MARHTGVRAVPAVITATVLLTACGGSTTAAPQPPTARTIAARMGCQILTTGNNFAGQDLAQDLRTQGGAPGCLSGEIFTFPSQRDETDWLRQAAPVAHNQSGTLYPWFVVGNLWAVNLGDAASQAQVASELGGKQVSFF